MQVEDTAASRSDAARPSVRWPGAGFELFDSKLQPPRLRQSIVARPSLIERLNAAPRLPSSVSRPRRGTARQPCSVSGRPRTRPASRGCRSTSTTTTPRFC